ncbi:hypothetical protein B0T24DRAFT_694793 [Lasiosphaeria ovina]|uniref:Uncharacterized protein n=1 Tax=Lasiosphaeria ovina TaxID=92902 RepID=A0AAE0KN27_9PEZI|nr:hypothetical protein B0T24DRAFT_694793 [Lasiosphaeria ovina]
MRFARSHNIGIHDQLQGRATTPLGIRYRTPEAERDAAAPLPAVDAYTVHGNSVDSGYVSALAPGSRKGALDSAQDGILQTIETTELAACDTETVYSNEGSVTGEELDAYKSELVDSLVGQDESNPEPERVDSEVATSRVSDWLANLEAPETEGRVGSEEATTQTRGPHYVLALDGEEPEEVVLPDKYGYRRVVFDSEGYKALVARIAREVSLTALVETDAMVKLRSTFLSALPNQRHVSRHLESKVFAVLLRVAWDPVAILRYQFQDSRRLDELVGPSGVGIVPRSAEGFAAAAFGALNLLRQTPGLERPSIQQDFGFLRSIEHEIERAPERLAELANVDQNLPHQTDRDTLLKTGLGHVSFDSEALGAGHALQIA